VIIILNEVKDLASRHGTALRQPGEARAWVILNRVKDLTRKVDTSFDVRSFTSFRMTVAEG
jgi:hypothetical protein